MRILKFLNNRSIGDRKGQVAIFVALIFQLLFLFFAMVVNVGLLVHHKINLQNSVDLAAYYGGMKQAEVLNAIAHINYQIRQSYKVLAWRYRVLGTAGVYSHIDNPVNKDQPAAANLSFNGGTIIPGAENDGAVWPGGTNNADHMFPAFCLSYKPFQEVPQNENTCQVLKGLQLKGLAAPSIIASFVGAVNTSINLVKSANLAQKNDCDWTSLFNYDAIGQFLLAYQIDQSQRKLLINHLANNLSITNSDFVDIDGTNASDGIRQTLKNNLTSANLDGQVGDIVVYNSLGDPSCSGSANDIQPPKWLKEISTTLLLNYLNCPPTPVGQSSQFQATSILNAPTAVGASWPNLVTARDSLKSLLGLRQQGANAIYNPSLGYEKNPWCMAYVGVSAQSEPKIPFSIGSVRLKSVAFAKPFGGKIGPWYGTTFARIADSESSAPNTATQTDGLLPLRCNGGSASGCQNINGLNDPAVNYSRFPGDQVGLASYKAQAEFGRSIFDLKGEPSTTYWDGISQVPSQRQNEYDILAWDNIQGSQNSTMNNLRKLEIAAAAPDIFDITYYSIDPDFYNNYYANNSRLSKYLSANPIQSGGGNFVVPFDIGSRANNGGPDYPTSFGVMNQLAIVGQLGTGPQSSSAQGYGINYDQLNYALFDPSNILRRVGSLLTSWVPPEQITDYELSPSRFGQCLLSIYDTSQTKPTLDAVPGTCIVGGRAGYSVKIISSDYLFDTHPLGGNGIAKDKILNPPPNSFLQ